MKSIYVAAKILMLCGALGSARAQTVTSLGDNVPIPETGDLTNFYTADTSFGPNEKPGGMNYYTDNGSGKDSPGQTFLSPTNGVLTSVAFQMGNNAGTYAGNGSGTGPGLFTLRVFQLPARGSASATLLATYLSPPNFTFSTDDWLQWTGIAVRLSNGVNYAYSIASGLNESGGPGNGSQMYCRVYCIPGDTYSNGSICLIQAAGGPNAVTYNSTADNYSQNFDIGFSDLSVLDKPLPVTPAVSPSATVYGGTPFTLTETATGANLHYQWQAESDGNNNNLTNIPGATLSNLVQVASYNGGNPVYYDVVVTNNNGAATSAVVQITVNPPSAPVLDTDLSTTSPQIYAGGSLTFSAQFEGTLPIYYQWLTNSGAGFLPLPGATNAAVTVTDLQPSSIGTIELIATNAIGASTTSVATVTVLPDPPAPATNQPYAYAVYANNPLAYWRFSETGDPTQGNLPAYDYSGHGYDAIYGSGVVDNANGPQSPLFAGFEATNACAQLPGPGFTGGNGYLVAPDLNLNTNTLTITTWINPTADVVTTAGLLIWRNNDGDAAGLGFGNLATNGMTELAYTWNGNSSLTWNHDFNLYPPLNQWSFVALTVTPTNATIYLYFVDSNTGATNLLNSVNTLNHTPEAFSGGTIRIGDDTFDLYRVFPGYLDELAVFTHCLTETQLQNLFYTAIGAPPALILDETWNGRQVTLSWTQGALLESTNLAGPWTPNPATSPYQVTPVGPQHFYRLTAQ